MFSRSPWKALLLVGFGLALTGCTNNLVDSIVVSPATQSLTVGQTVQFSATGLQTHGTHPSTDTNVTALVTWSSSAPSVATVNSAGLATAVSAGSTTVTASMQGFGGVISGSAVITVTGNGTISAEPLASLAIDPGSQTALAVNQTVDFIAIGTTGANATVNLTSQSATIGSSTIKPATWTSSNPAIATVNPNTGIATALTSGSTTISAQAVNPDGTVVIGTATLTVTLAASSPEPLVSMTLIPGTQTLTSVNQPAQFIAIGTTGTGTTVNLTNKVVWTSSSPTVASINGNSGVATAIGNGTAAITAVATNPDGTVVTGVGTVTVNIATTGEPLVSLAIVPGTQTASVVGQTAQFIAIGTTSTGATVNLTNQTATIGASTIGAAVWGSSSVAVATVNPATGIASAVSTGSVAITAQAKNPDGTVVTGTAAFTVISTPEPLISLTIVPGTQTLASGGQTAQYIAIGTTASGATVNLTNAKATIGTATINAATWSSSTAAVAAINPVTGVATAGTSGSAVITAVAYNPDGTAVTGTAALTVAISPTQEPLVSLTVVPATQTTSVVGQAVDFIAIGTTSSGTTVNLTNQTATVGAATINAAVWGSSSPAVATVNPATGVASAVSSGSVAITAQAKNPDGTVVTGTATFTVISTPEPLVSLAIVPATQTLSAAGQTAGFIAIGTTATGATVNLTNQTATIGAATIKAASWSSSDTSVGTINPITGIATSASSGTTVVTAVAYNPDGTAVTGTATLTVNISATQEPLVSLTIIPATQTTSVVGQTVQFIAIGTTSAGTTVNLTAQSATVGTATIGAAVWGSSSPAVATVSPGAGVASAVSAGTVAITAQAKNPDGTVVTGVATFTVTSTPEPLVSLTVLPGSQTLNAAGQPAQFIAIGTTASGATVNLTNAKATIGTAVISAAVWGSSSMSVATINPVTGLATAGTSGTTVITAIAYNPDGTAVTGTATLAVNITASPEPLVSLAIVPASQEALAANQTAQFIAIGTTASGTTVNLTDQGATIGSATIAAAAWTTSNPSVASVNAATGVATALSAGSAAITAIAKNPDGTVVTGTAVYTVTIPTATEPVVSMAVNPAAQTLTILGQTANLQAIATTGTGTTVNLTNHSATIGAVTILPAVWTSSVPGVATVNAGTGVVTAVNAGTTVVTATASNPDGTVITGVSTITVTATGGLGGTIASIAVIPGTQGVAAPNDTAQFIAIGTTTTGATVNLTNQVVWSSSSAQVGTIGAVTGLATGSGQGTATITALYTPGGGGNVITGTAQFTVAGGTTEEYTAVTIIPNTQTLSVGQTNQFIALGTLGTSGLMVDVTSSPQIKWSSSVGGGLGTIASVGATGAVLGVSAGSTTITAELNNPDGTVVSSNAAITVSSTTVPEPLLSLTIIPSTLTVGNLQDTGNFLAIGTFSQVPYVRDLTNDPNTTWISSFPESFPVNTNSGGNAGASAGTVTAYGTGVATIIAETKSADGTIQTAQATFSCPYVLPNPPLAPGSCFPGSQSSGLLVTLTIYNEGVNNTNWLVTAPSATATPNVLHCGPGWTGAGGSVCTATYPLNTTVVLTATQTGGGTGTFGGWSWDCTPSDSSGTPLPGPVFYTAAGPNYCSILLVNVADDISNVTVGAIFN